MDYDLELPKIIEEARLIAIGKVKPLKVCLQFPDGLKANATEIVSELEKELPNAEFMVWAGTNFGGCDYPWYLKDHDFDLLVNFGHALFQKSGKCR